MKTEIAQNEIYIRRLIEVLHGFNFPRTNPMRAVGREYDGFIYILDGCCKYTFDDGTCFTVQKNEILYLAKNARYRMDISCGKYEFIYFNFEFDDNSTRLSRKYSVKNHMEVKNIFFRLKNNFETKKGLSVCMADVYRIYSIICKSTENTYLSSGSRYKIKKAEEYISSRLLDDSLSIGEIAGHLNISEVYLRKLFKNQLGCSPSEYITQHRLDNAANLLSSGMFTVEEAALQSGFSSISYFCHIFKLHKGTTPGAYKKSIKS